MKLLYDYRLTVCTWTPKASVPPPSQSKTLLRMSMCRKERRSCVCFCSPDTTSFPLHSLFFPSDESALSFRLFTVQFKTGVTVMARLLYIMRSPKCRRDGTSKIQKPRQQQEFPAPPQLGMIQSKFCSFFFVAFSRAEFPSLLLFDFLTEVSLIHVSSLSSLHSPDDVTAHVFYSIAVCVSLRSSVIESCL